MSEPNKVRVAVNGYGVIGKRVAAAVALQEDMSLAGVSTALNRDATRVVSCNTTSIVRTLTALKLSMCGTSWDRSRPRGRRTGCRRLLAALPGRLAAVCGSLVRGVDFTLHGRRKGRRRRLVVSTCTVACAISRDSIVAITLGAMKAGRRVVSSSPRLVDQAGLTPHGRFAIIQIRI